MRYNRNIESTEEYEVHAQVELRYLYAVFKDFKLKKDAIMAKVAKTSL